MNSPTLESRVRQLNPIDPQPGPVGCVLARDHRAHDNWVVLHAQRVALEYKSPLLVIIPFAADYSDLPERQRWFLSESLRELERDLSKLNIPLIITEGNPVEQIIKISHQYQLSHLVVDFSPLTKSRRWKQSLVEKAGLPIDEVDAHNVVPVWEASDKLEYAAYTIRPKINRRLDNYLTEIPRPKRHPFTFEPNPPASDWTDIELPHYAERAQILTQRWKPGRAAGLKATEQFFNRRFDSYHTDRNDPNADGQSGLSPYLHFGLVSAQRVAMDAHRFESNFSALEDFLDELIVRRELSDNLCYYNQNYDSTDGFSDWARQTLDDHRADRRTYTYTYEQFDSASTDDELWNAAQTEMVVTGKMHGYLRMYWAKKILEWTESPETALDIANRLNDLYELDGNDPNGYAGTAWSIGGTHDRAWPERPIFGKIRYMNFNGCKRKFDVPAYIARMVELRQMDKI